MATAANFIPLTLYALLDIMACRLYNRAIKDQIFYRSSGKILLDDSNEKNQAKEHERAPVSVRCPQVIERLAKIDCLFVDKEGTFETDRRLVRSIVIDGHEWVSQWREQADVDYEATIEEFS
jgi:magnesium-transporting ATPase (P-type)